MDLRQRLAAVAVAAVSSFALADAVRLRSGDVVEGSVEDLGDRIRVRTEKGDLSIRWRDVDVVDREASAEALARAAWPARRAAVPDSDARGLFELATWARRAGLAEESRAACEAALRADPEHAGARDALAQQKSGGTWLAGDELLAAKGFVAREGAWVLREEAAALDRRAAAGRTTDVEKKVEQVIEQAAKAAPAARKFACESLSDVDAAEIVRPALRALRRGTPAAREVGARLLARSDDVDVLRPLLHAAVMDREPSVRAAAAESLASIGNPDVVKPLAKAMWSDVPAVRMNGAEALGTVGGVRSVEWLVARVATSGGPGGRNHLFVGSQVSYISDFDVEIAQAAQIGDPIVSTIREGVTLDARVLNVREEFTVAERRVVYEALRRATGKSLGDDPVAWKSWLDGDGRKELQARADVAR